MTGSVAKTTTKVAKTVYEDKTVRTVHLALSEDEAVVLAALVGGFVGDVSYQIYEEFDRLGFGAGTGYQREGEIRNVKITNLYTGKEVK